MKVSQVIDELSKEKQSRLCPKSIVGVEVHDPGSWLRRGLPRTKWVYVEIGGYSEIRDMMELFVDVMNRHGDLPVFTKAKGHLHFAPAQLKRLLDK